MLLSSRSHVFADKADAESFPNVPQRIVADLRRAMPSDGILSLDNGMYKIWFARNYQAHQPNTVLLDNALATMGAGLPAAIAAQLLLTGDLPMTGSYIPTHPAIYSPILAGLAEGGLQFKTARAEIRTATAEAT